jgi:MYXO-CTERM domain-containing protein
MHAPWSSMVALVLVAGVAGLAGAAPPPLPEGDQGIAAGYPGDEGIDGDPAVVFFDDFEGYAVADDLWDRYDNVYQLDQIRFATEPTNRYAGDQALEFTVPQQEAELSNAVDKAVSPELDVMFLRYYSKFSSPFDVVGSSHNGSSISAHYFVDGQATPGVPADGTNKFLVAYEDWRGEPETPSPGLLNVYVYHPEQRDAYGDHFFPSGLVMPNTSLPFDFGPDFVPRPEVIPELERWYCWEYMVQANTPGQRDGRIAAWLDGVLVADWQGLRLRDVDALTIDRFGLSLHIGSNPSGEQKKWFDNVVAATAYIGPLYVPGGDGSGGADEGSGTAGQGDDTAGTATGSAGGSTSSAPPGDASGASGGTEGSAPAEGDGGGCGCRAPERTGAAWWLVLPGLVAAARRRRALRTVGARSAR